MNFKQFLTEATKKPAAPRPDLWSIVLDFTYADGAYDEIQADAVALAKRFKCGIRQKTNRLSFEFTGAKHNLKNLSDEYGEYTGEEFEEVVYHTPRAKIVTSIKPIKPPKLHEPEDAVGKALIGKSFQWKLNILKTYTITRVDRHHDWDEDEELDLHSLHSDPRKLKRGSKPDPMKSLISGNFFIYIDGLDPESKNGHPYGEDAFTNAIEKFLPPGTVMDYTENGMQGDHYIHVEITFPKSIK